MHSGANPTAPAPVMAEEEESGLGHLVEKADADSVGESDGASSVDSRQRGVGGGAHRMSTRARSPETEMASLVSRALVGDLQQLGSSTLASGELANTGVAATTSTSARDREVECCICNSPAVYTCPGCGRRTCSVTCVRVHKVNHACSGERNVAAKVPLSSFTDAQLQRDFRFLSDCQRVISNASRQLPRTRRFDFKALPPPLRALREAARRHGVVCQLMSEGMAKRVANTSRYDRSTNTITWRCDFVFHQRSGEAAVVSTNWGSERHRLGEVLMYCWSTNPPLPCYPVNLTYNRRDRYVDPDADNGSPTPTAAKDEAPSQGDDHEDGSLPPFSDADDDSATDAEEEDDRGGDGEASCDSVAAEGDREASLVACGKVGGEGPGEEVLLLHETGSSPAHTEERGPEEEEVGSRPADPANAVVPPQTSGPVPVSLPEVVPLTPLEVRNEALVRVFLADASAGAGWRILSRAERLGAERKYFLLDPDMTLNETMRVLFFVNEYPVFDVIRAEELDSYPLVTNADKEAIRTSFRPKERTPEELLRRHHPGLRLKSDLSPEEAERLAQVPCRMNLVGRCVAGDRCPYWHCTVNEWPQCRSYEKHGRCAMGYRCSFRHGDRLPGEAPPPSDEGMQTGKRPRDGVRGRGRGRGLGYGRGRSRGRGFGGRGRGCRY